MTRTVRIVRGITDEVSSLSRNPLPSWASVHRTGISRTILRSDWLQFVALVVIASTSVGVCDEQTASKLVVVDGTPVAATFEVLKPNWSIVVHVAGEQKEFVRSDYVMWGSYSDQERGSQVLLTDGTILGCDIVRMEAESVTIASRLWGELRIARRLVRACLLLPAADPLKRDRQWQLLQKPESTDRVLLLNGDAVAGRLLPTEERDRGGLFGLDAIGIRLLGNDVTTSVRMEEATAISFQTTPAEAVPTECLLGFRDGSLVTALKLTQAESGWIEITTATGASLHLSGEEFREHLAFVQPGGETVSYLSDLPAFGYRSLPFLKLDWPLGIATNTLGGRLRSGGNVIFKGLGMHSVSRVAYTLDRKYRRFEAELALDDQAQRQGSVVYRVLVERESEAGERAWNLAFTSPTVRGGDPPLSVTVDVTAVTRLALVVEMADRVDTRDYANWLNARLLR